MNPIKQTTKGSATTDFLVAGLVLVPLFLLYPIIGKISDIEHSSQQSARYIAWERTTSTAAEKSDATLGLEVQSRIVNQQFFIESNTKESAQEIAEKSDRTLWAAMNPEGSGSRQELVSFDQQGIKSTGGSSQDLGNSSDLLIITHGMKDLDRNGLHQAEVDIAINEIALLGLKGKNTCNTGERESYLTCFNRHNTILVDDWSASSPAQVQDRVQKRMPFTVDVWKPIAEVMGTAADLFDAAGDPLGFNPLEDLKHIDEAPGYVAPDVVPQSKLGSYEEEGIKESLD